MGGQGVHVLPLPLHCAFQFHCSFEELLIHIFYILFFFSVIAFSRDLWEVLSPWRTPGSRGYPRWINYSIIVLGQGWFLFFHRFFLQAAKARCETLKFLSSSSARWFLNGFQCTGTLWICYHYRKGLHALHLMSDLWSWFETLSPTVEWNLGQNSSIGILPQYSGAIRSTEAQFSCIQ